MPLLPDIKSGAQFHGDPKDQIDALVKQLNEWGRAISNEDRTRVIKSDSGVEALTIGQVPDIGNGVMIRDEDDTRRAMFGSLPDGTIAIVITKPGNDIVDVIS